MDERILNRELSWLDFNDRVLAQAAEATVPLLERAKFLAICSSNLDEFFQVRVAALKDQIAAGITMPSPDGRLPSQQLLEVMDRVHRLVKAQESLLIDELLPGLAAAGIRVCRWDELERDDQKLLIEVFEQRIFPVLTPLAVDPGHPFPYISNLSLNLGVMVREPDGVERRFARVKVPQLLPRFLPVGEDRMIAIEEVIAAQLAYLFPGMVLDEHLVFRVTRNADLTLEEEEADDLLEAVEVELRRRRFGKAVRIEVEAGVSENVLRLLLDELDLDDDDVTYHRSFVDLTGLFVIHSLDRPNLKDDAWPAITPRPILHAMEEERSLFSVIRDSDLLIHHPYESFAGSVEAFIASAADDPRVQSIKMTLYRTSGDSPIVNSLVRAAERGVQVAVLVELKARFDEQANIAWAKMLERAGVHVVYGLVGLKTHSKCVLVVREDGDGLRRYAHIGTGNYNSKTARTYEDLGLLTADPEIGADLGELFNHLTGFSLEERYRRLLVAPNHLRHEILDLIAKEGASGGDGLITLKLNSLTDPEIIEALYAASEAGAQVDLLVRGICCLRPGVPGMSERITVRSILGRYLEHSRILWFANGAGPGRPLTFIGSADLMPRNLDRRVEALAPVQHPAHQERLRGMLDMLLADDVLAWQLGPDAAWQRRTGEGLADVQRRFAESITGGRRTPPSR
ncbi:MAG: polyphosphate kinase 1 [Acidimicrobiia bacterium]